MPLRKGKMTMKKEYRIIKDIDDERVSLYTKYNEPQLLHYNEPGRGIFIAETPMVIERAIDYGAKPVSFFLEEKASDSEAVCKVIEKAGDDAAVYVAELSVIKNLTGFNLTRGMLAAFERPILPDLNFLLEKGGCIAVLENIVNPTNVGAIFRSAAAMGVDALLLTSGSADPFYRRAARVSMGTVFQVPWTYLPKDEEWVDFLHEAGFTVISMELEKEALPLTDPALKSGDKRAIVFGTEGPGVSRNTLEKSDHIAVIPMYNGVDSLNVAASSAVAFWELCGKEKNNDWK